MQLSALLPALQALIQQAGSAIMDIYQQDAPIAVVEKADASPLTLADQASHAILIRGLQELRPDWPVVSEESPTQDFAERRHYDWYWLIDPLDGTKEFVQRNGDFAINLALMRRSQPVLGLVWLPYWQELYWGIRGEGAFSVRAGTIQRLAAASFRLSDPGLRVVGSRAHQNSATLEFVQQLQEPRWVARGSSLKFLLLAAGEAELYPRLAPTMEWDTAAPQLILEEAGGRVIDQATQAPLVYNKESLRNPDFIAYGQRLPG